MPFVMVRLKPGVNAELTPSLLEAGYQVSNQIRFRNGLAEKLGGWTAYYDFAVGGVPKALHAWLDLNEVEYLGVGTTTTLAAISEGTLTDLTPQTLTSDFAPDFDTTNTSPTVVVNDPNIANVTIFDTIEFKTPVSVGGIILSGIYPINLVLGTTEYNFIAADDATASVTAGGAVPVFTYTSGSQVVSVTLNDHGLAVGDTINFPIETLLNTTGNDNFTKALLHMNGSDASTTFTDSNAGGSAHVWTAAGNAQIDTASFEFGGASGLFDGTGDYVTTPDHADFTLGSGDFTVDFWFNCNVAGGTLENLCGQCDASATNASTSFRMYRTTGNFIEGVVCVGGTAFTVTGTTQYTNAANTGWHHCALVRSGSDLKLFIDGAQQGATTAIAGTVNDSASVLGVGTTGAVTTDPWTGWIDEFRLSVGTARWTAAFTVPAAQYGAQTASVEGTYTATTINSVNSFDINISSLAGATGVTAMNGGDVRIVYYIALGPEAGGTGYGIGTYGSGGYGTGSTSGAQTGTPLAATDWTLDNWGQTFIACPDGGGIYAWTPNTGFTNAQFVSGAPPYNTGAFISMQTQMLICYGSTEEHTIGIDQDPLLVKWSAQGDYADFVPSTESQAGSRRLPQGSKIVSALSVPNSELLWTDLDLWQMNYLGSLAAGVWGFNKIGSNCGLIGKHAIARQGNNIFWMGLSDFWMSGGGVPAALACPVRDTVFQDLNTDYKHKCWVWSNTTFGEFWAFYPRASTNATEPDAYVKFCPRENTWDYGPLDRTAGIDQSILGMPISATSAGIIYEHETSQDAAGQAINSYFTTGDFQLSEGQEMMFVDWVLPDMRFNLASGEATSASLQITFTAKNYPGDTGTTYGPFTFTSTTQYLNPRFRGRLFSMTVSSNDLGSFWRLGGCRVRAAPDGRL